MKIGVHSVLFKNKIGEDTYNLLKDFRDMSATCTEIGSRFFPIEKSNFLLEQLNKTDMELAGVHCYFSFDAIINNKEKVIDNISEIAKSIIPVNCNNIVMSSGYMGNESNRDLYKDKDVLKKLCANLDEISLHLLKNYSVYLNYHNHDWEFLDGAVIFKALMSDTTHLKFAIDVGWTGAAGYPAIDLIKQAPEKFTYIHIRDYDKTKIPSNATHDELSKLFCNIGDGDSDLPELLKYLKSILSDDDFIIIEYETGEEDLNRYKNALNYVKPFLY